MKRIFTLTFLFLIAFGLTAQNKKHVNAFEIENQGYFSHPIQTQNGLIVGDNFDSQIFKVVNGEMQTLLESPGCARYVAISPDEKKLGFKQINPDGKQSPAILDISTGKVKLLNEEVDVCGQVSFSTDGKIAYTIGNTLKVRSGSQIMTFDLGNYSNLAPISPNGKLVAFIDANEKISVIDLSNGNIKQVSTAKGAYTRPVWSPDSKKLLYTALEGNIFVYNTEKALTYELGKASDYKWADNSQDILFHKVEIDRMQILNSDIYIAKFDGSDLTNLTNTPDEFEMEASFNGNNRIIYHKYNKRQVVARELTAKRSLKAEEILISTDEPFKKLAAEKQVHKNTRADVKLDGYPYLNQVWDTPYKGTNYNYSSCAPTTSAMVLGFYQKVPEWPTSRDGHTVNYAAYVGNEYTAYGVTYNLDANSAQGGYGYMWDGSRSPSQGYMRDYMRNHELESDYVWSGLTWDRMKQEIDLGYALPICSYLSSSGHLTLAIGYETGRHVVIMHDPYGDKNTGSWPNRTGDNVRYDWDGYNNGYQDVKPAWYVTARGSHVPSRPVLHAVHATSTPKAVALSWAQNQDSDLAGYRLYYSSDDNLSTWNLAANENTLTSTTTYYEFSSPADFAVPTNDDVYYFKLTAVNTEGEEGESSDIYCRSSHTSTAGLKKILIVDGFDRFAGSWTSPTHSFATNYFKAMRDASGNNYMISSAANEIVADGTVPMSNYDIVVWFVGDESTTDYTFYGTEQTKIQEYLENGGRLFVSGSEIGWDLYNKGDTNDKAFFNNYLKANYVSDGGSGRTPATGIDGTDFQGAWLNFGSVYPEDYPDDISPNGGAVAVMKYNDDNTCGVAYTGTFGSGTTEGQIVYISFPLETVSELTSTTNFMTKLLNYFDTGKPVADFTMTGLPAKKNENITFDASASSDDGSITSYAWNFGDGSTATGVSLTHAYAADGTYNVVLTVTDNEGNQATKTHTVEINSCIAPSNTEVIIDYGDAGYSETGTWYSSTSSAGYNGTDYRHENNANKGACKVIFNPDIEVSGTYEVFIKHTSHENRASNVPVTVHAYNETKTTTVNQQENNGTWITLGFYIFAEGNTGYIELSNEGTNGYVIADAVKIVFHDCEDINLDATAGFTPALATICQGESISFTNTSENADTYNWTFEGGTPGTSTVVNPTVTYNTSGIYDVSLVAANANNSDTKTLTDIITVNPLVGTAGAINGEIALCINSADKTYTIDAVANAASYVWAIAPANAGTIASSGASAVVNWNDAFAGTATISVKAQNSCGESNQVALDVEISPAPAATFTSDANSVQVGGSINFAATEQNAASYSWTFEGGSPSTSTEANPAVTYSSEGSFDVTLTVTDACGNQYTTTQTDMVSAYYDINIENPEISIVTVDNSQQKNLINWDVQTTNQIASYNIYKEGIIAGQFELVDNVAYADAGQYVDNNSNPAQKAERYKISAVDVAGAETALSQHHKTIHLTVNEAVNGGYNLIWDAYEGFDYKSFKIYRGTSAGDMALLSQIQGNLFSYTDKTAPAGTVVYGIEVVKTSTKKSKEKLMSMSNIVLVGNATSISGFEKDEISVYPNPATEYVIINCQSSQEIDIRVFDIKGKQVLQQRLTNKRIDLNSLESGVYFINISTQNKNGTLKLIKK